MPERPLPSSHRPRILTEADLDNHPMATEYIDYLERSLFPKDFQAWLIDRAQELSELERWNKRKIANIANDPYCRSPLKRRVIR